MSIISHRASYSLFSENSLDGINYSYDIGCNGIEIDVRSNKLGDIIVIHDTSTKRTHDLNIDVKNLTKEECQKMEILLFENVIKKIQNINNIYNFLLFVDMKETNLWENIINYIDEINTNYIILQTPEIDILKKIRKKNSMIKLAYLIYDYEQINLLIKNNVWDLFDILSIDYKMLSISLVNMIKKNKKKIFTWTIDNVKDSKILEIVEVDYICTGYPEKFIK